MNEQLIVDYKNFLNNGKTERECVSQIIKLVEKAGFKDIEIIYTENSRPPFEIPELKLEGGENTEEFNKALKKVSDMLFGSQDYAVVATKKG